MVLATNIASMSVSFQLAETSSRMQVSVERLGTGLRIKKAQDDPAGNAIADNLRMQANTTRQGLDNSTTAVAMLQIADKAMRQQSEVIDSLKSNIISALNATYDSTQLKIPSAVIERLISHIDEIASQTSFAGMNLLQKSSSDDSSADLFSFAVDSELTIDSSGSIRSNSKGLGLESLMGGNLTKDDLRNGLSLVDNALSKLSEFRSEYGSLQQQIESSMRNLMSQQTNMKLSESVVRDVDFVKEYATLSQTILTYKAGSFALTQANLSKESVLDILV